MLLFFVMFVFFIMHIQGLLRFIFFHTYETTYYLWTITYLYNPTVATESLLFAIACATSFAIGYSVFYRKRAKSRIDTAVPVDLEPYRVELRLFFVFGILQIASSLVLAILTRFDYSEIVDIKNSHPFMFQSRLFFLVILAHLLLNIPLRQFWVRRDLRVARWITISYVCLTVLLQFRSEIFEVACIIVFSCLMWVGDKIKIKYILFTVCSLIGPNLIALARLGFPNDPVLLGKALFSFEYSTLFNNILSEAISRGQNMSGGLTFLPSMVLLIPSPVRDVLGIAVSKSDYYDIVSSSADVLGGGFSFLGEMFSNFGWLGIAVFAAFGIFIGKMNAGASRVGRVSVFYAGAPLLFEYFILTFRNDFGVLLKQIIQLFIVAALIGFMRRLRVVSPSSRSIPFGAPL